jgi:hypothetical protein
MAGKRIRGRHSRIDRFTPFASRRGVSCIFSKRSMDLPHLTAGKRFTLPRPPLSADALLLAQLGMREKAAGRATAMFTADANDAQRLIDEIAFFAPDLRCALVPRLGNAALRQLFLPTRT